MGDETLFHAGQENGVELKALGRMKGHEKDVPPGFAFDDIDVAQQSGLIQIIPQPEGGVRFPFALELLQGIRKLLQDRFPARLTAKLRIPRPGQETMEQVRDRQAHGFFRQSRHELMEIRHPVFGRAMNRLAWTGNDVPNRPAGLPGGLLQLLDRRPADSAGGDIDYPQERVFGPWVHQDLEIGNDILDLLPVEEPEPGHHTVRDAVAAEGLLKRTRLGVRAKKHRRAARSGRVARPSSDVNHFGGDVFRLGPIVRGRIEDQLLAGLPRGDEGLVPPAAISLDHARGPAKDGGR